VDPYLTWFNIWRSGALGELQTAALEAARNGDEAGCRELSARYWLGVAAALERRHVLEDKRSDDRRGPRSARRTGG
jgi:hypothetical protein